jgi:hypothetical protein
MRNAAANDAPVQSHERNDSHCAIVSDLVSLIAHVQAAMGLIELAIARELPLGNQEAVTNVVVLDDVTPRYVKANTALSTCNAGLGVALHFLQDAGASKYGARESAAADRRPAGSIGPIKAPE